MDFETREQARLAIFDYIEGFYNRTRMHSMLDRSPSPRGSRRSLCASGSPSVRHPPPPRGRSRSTCRNPRAFPPDTVPLIDRSPAEAEANLPELDKFSRPRPAILPVMTAFCRARARSHSPLTRPTYPAGSPKRSLKFLSSNRDVGPLQPSGTEDIHDALGDYLADGADRGANTRNVVTMRIQAGTD
jgi:hypothetical protein